jgi:hypothetical protein
MAKSKSTPKRAASSPCRIKWGVEGGRQVIAKETRASREVQALRWQQLVATAEALKEVACAIREWRSQNTVTAGHVGLGVAAAHVTTLVPALIEHINSMANLSPTLRASRRALEARQATMLGNVLTGEISGRI